jgi:spore maturation protein CgeB
VSDYWTGLESIFEIGREILVARSPGEVLEFLRDVPEDELAAIGQRARLRVLEAHTAARRAAELERYAVEALNGKG